VSYKVIGQSVFDKVLLNKKIDLKIGRENIKLQETNVSEIAHKDYCYLPHNINLGDALKIMVKEQKSESYLIDENQKLINKFELHSLLNKNNKKQVLNKLKTNNFLKLKEKSSIFESIQKCKTFVGESIPVVKENGEILGVVSEGDLFQIYLKITNEEKKHEHED
jgi:Mg/Co/Ni transporter MgtE